jgi:hypothetical protein
LRAAALASAAILLFSATAHASPGTTLGDASLVGSGFRPPPTLLTSCESRASLRAAERCASLHLPGPGSCALRSSGWWVYDPAEREENPIPRLRFAPHVGFWAANFDRPTRACEEDRIAFIGCANDDSDEIGVAAGASMLVRVFGPIHLSASIELVYTFPERDFVLKNQLIIPMPIAIGITFPNWPIRPILSGSIMPVLYVTDDARDYALGVEGGFAWRVLSLGELAIVGSYHSGDTLESFVMRVAIFPR